MMQVLFFAFVSLTVAFNSTLNKPSKQRNCGGGLFWLLFWAVAKE